MVDVPLAEAPAGTDPEAWAAACAAVRSYCGWHIAPSATETVKLDGPGSSLLLLPTLHLTELADVTSDGRAVTDPEWSEAGMVRGSWSSRFRGVSVTMTHGYTECPPEVLAIVRDLAKAAPLSGAASMSAGPFTTSLPENVQAGAVGLSPMQQAVLDRYRIGARP